MPAHRRPSLLRTLLRPTTPHTTTRYTMTGLMNVTTSPHGWSERHYGFQPWHPLAQVHDPAHPGHLLTFTIDAADLHTAATRARAIATATAADLHSTWWPPTMNRLATGDVIALTTGDTTRYFALAPHGALTALPCINDPIPPAHLPRRPALAS
ncbi:hypothetical protein PUR61_38575 [Streptomyces sp. BE20]|uniref:hypothetical protein n=1 Tax=Streptomyces sp. BE20 TaxID=3002525 RepID=UPI002E7A7762|nr:hypothetical protein [Streptomyces sp. BE20]MEE1828042.1 hypothetical protein [Streptomyces sp. BE20]